MDFLGLGVEVRTQALVDADASRRIGAEPYERSAQRQTHRNGYRDPQWDTRVGRIDPRIPKLRSGSFFPEFLEPRRRTERALLSVVQGAHIQGVSTRKMDEVFRAMGLNGITKSEVSRICQELDATVQGFLERPWKSR